MDTGSKKGYRIKGLIKLANINCGKEVRWQKEFAKKKRFFLEKRSSLYT